MCNFYLRWETKIMTLHCRCEQICLRSLWFLDHARYNPVTFLHNCPRNNIYKILLEEHQEFVKCQMLYMKFGLKKYTTIQCKT